MTTCKIQWIDDAGNPTPDSNPAITEVRCVFSGSPGSKPSEWFPICAEHLKQMPPDGSWEVRNLIETAASALAKIAGYQTIADVMNCLLSCDYDERLTETEGEKGLSFFEELCELRPECIPLAQGRAYVATVQLENESPGGSKTEAWVARDDKGDWRTYAQKHFAKSAVESVPTMYHAEEIVAIKPSHDGSKAFAVIVTGA